MAENCCEENAVERRELSQVTQVPGFDVWDPLYPGSGTWIGEVRF